MNKQEVNKQERILKLRRHSYRPRCERALTIKMSTNNKQKQYISFEQYIVLSFQSYTPLFVKCLIGVCVLSFFKINATT